MSLPPELLDQIIDEIGLINPAADRIHPDVPRNILAQCLRVSHSFRNRAIRYLFRTVRVIGTLHQMKQKTVLLKSILAAEGSPSMLPIVHVIQEFELSFAKVGRVAIGSLVQDSGRTRPFETLLRLFRQHMTDGNGPTTFNLHLGRQTWKVLPNLFRTEIMLFTQSPRLNSLSLQGLYGAPPSLFCGMSIKHLSIQDVRFHNQYSNPGEEPPPRLTRFKCRGFIPGFILPRLSDFICNELFCELKYLEWLDAEFEDPNNFAQLLRASASSLEQLEVGISSSALRFTEAILTSITNLRELYLKVECIPSTLLNVNVFFCQQDGVEKLRDIWLVFTEAAYSASSNSQLPPGLHDMKHECKRLDDCLTSSRYPSLKAVEIIVELEWPGYWQGSAAVQEVRSGALSELGHLFPSLTVSPSIDFIPSVKLIQSAF